MNLHKNFRFEIEKKSSECLLARIGKIFTPHGIINTPAFIPVGTKASVKALQVSDLLEINSQAVLANTYHLYLQPGEDIIKKNGGFAKMMCWNGPTFTDSGGFQVLSLGAAFNSGITKIATDKKIAEEKHKHFLTINQEGEVENKIKSTKEQMAKVDEEGVTFKSFIDGKIHRLTPEKSVQIQHDLGADIFFAFDECTSPLASKEYQIKAMNRTHRWAKRCLEEHERLGVSNATGMQQAIYGVVQGSGYVDLRQESARVLSDMNFDGYGIGGSFTKADIERDVSSVCSILPESKPRHLLGMGEDPIDFFSGVEAGIDTFDCVSPTRLARHGHLYTDSGKINLKNSKYKDNYNFFSNDSSHPLYGYTFSYLSHLYRSDEILASILGSKNNLYFCINLVEQIRQSILNDNFYEFKKQFCERYYKETSIK